MGPCHGVMHHHSKQMIYVFQKWLFGKMCVSVLGPALQTISEEAVCDLGAMAFEYKLPCM